MFQSIQAGRAIAALAVAAFHLSLTMETTRYYGASPFGSWTGPGHLGVDFFFVLSGFIILFAHREDIDHPGRLGTYLFKRGVRIYPIYLLYTLGLTALLLLGFGSGTELPSTWMGWASSLLLVRLNGESPPIGVAWTLFHEVLFYLAFASFLIKRQLGIAVFTGWLVLILVQLYLHPDPASQSRVLFSAYNLNFFAGMAAFWLYRYGSPAACRFALAAGLAVLCTAGLIAFNEGGISTYLRVVLAVGLAALMPGVLRFEEQRQFPRMRPLTLVGDASYSLYLLHLALQGLLLKICLKLGLVQHLGLGGVYFLVLTATAACACVAYLLVEKPLLGYLRSRYRGGWQSRPEVQLQLQGPGGRGRR